MCPIPNLSTPDSFLLSERESKMLCLFVCITIIFFYYFRSKCSICIQQPITWTCPHVHNEMLQCTINNSPSSEVWFLNPTQLVTQLSANFDNLPNSIQTGSNLAGWVRTFIEVSISVASAKAYAQTFSCKEIMRVSLYKLGIRTMDDMLVRLKLTKEPLVSLTLPAHHAKPPTVKLPQLNSKMTSKQFWKFWIDGDVITKMTILLAT